MRCALDAAATLKRATCSVADAARPSESDTSVAETDSSSVGESEGPEPGEPTSGGEDAPEPTGRAEAASETSDVGDHPTQPLPALPPDPTTPLPQIGAGGTCAYCQNLLPAAPFVCPSCGAAYHPDCWVENGGCAIPGCASAARDPDAEQGIDSGVAPLPVAGTVQPPVGRPPASGPPQPTDAFAAAAAGGPARKRIPPLALIGGALVIVGLVLGIAVLRHHPTHHLTGTYTILDSSGFSHTYYGGSCAPALGYSDIVPYSNPRSPCVTHRGRSSPPAR